MRRLLYFALSLSLVCANRAASDTPTTGAPGRNLFRELLGQSESQVDARIGAAWHQYFYGPEDTQRLYFPVDGGMAYIPDVANNDVRTEGLSYGMMICVQLDKQSEFNEIWKWAKTYLYHASGPAKGYFAWHADFEGEQLDPGPAPDGEEWFVTALFFASHRWGNGSGIFNYEFEAQSLLRSMLHKTDDPAHGAFANMFDATEKQIVFVPEGPGSHFTDTSYHLPFFYELWGQWASSPEDRAFCLRAAARSRLLFKQAANPSTGLMPDYCDFDGKPIERRGHEDFRYDAWRTLSYPALDYLWFNRDAWIVERSNRVLRFLAAQGPLCPDLFTIDGRPVSKDFNATGLSAMAAAAGLAADPQIALPFVRRLWEMEPPAGHYRYYNGLLYLMAMLEVSGRFRLFFPPHIP
jgi:oligosaccharide reducing-end xylanase